MNGWLPTFETLDQAQSCVLRTLLDDGVEVRPRGSLTREVLGLGFTVSRPRSRCVINPERRFNLPLALGEFAWHAAASDDLNFISYYARRWRDFADDESHVTGSCYGAKIFGVHNGVSQWAQLLDTLRGDVHSRRAVLSLWDTARSTTREVKDVPCTCTIQFLVRGGTVHAVVHMRSNDVVWGLPYDFFFFTMLQEILAAQLGLELGTYTHFASSMHIYERHFALAENILSNPVDAAFEMPPLTAWHELPDFLAAERVARVGAASPDVEGLTRYWRELVEVLLWFRRGRDAGRMSAVRRAIPHNRYGWLLDQMITPTAPPLTSAG